MKRGISQTRSRSQSRSRPKSEPKSEPKSLGQSRSQSRAQNPTQPPTESPPQPNRSQTRSPTRSPARSKRARSAARPRTKAEQRAETSEQILDAAEYLFSRRGLYGVSLRDVAKHVGVHESLVKYYFDDKTKLFETVFARRADVTIERRMRALEEYERRAGARPTVEGALRAFIDTDLDLYYEGGEGWMNYGAFGAQVSNTPEGAERMDHHFDPLVLKLISILQRALPNHSEEDIFWGYDFVTGALMHVLGRTGRIDRLSAGRCRSDDFPAIKRRFARFMAAGFKAIKTR